ncbi:hypothetical protein H5410_033571 [Solanum commersonii]|uniref:non-specific serine/threonine protein kinase n=1 Tax=Solanum commersonii TaxID=4109 RepID=A0A9J5YP27_SOLCO|nr:hypothetical protein H5410_033571 [Solanum commersonii]
MELHLMVRFFYSFTCRENLYLVMEYLNGGDLYSLLRNLGCLDEEVVRVYIAEVVLALEYLHSQHVVHRDLKPVNLLIAHDGHIKLALLFGELLVCEPFLTSVKLFAMVKESKYGFTADWWSVGIILFELIVGVPPFNAEHPQVNMLSSYLTCLFVPQLLKAAVVINFRLLTEDPNMRLGARGASEVKQHPFFRDINWDTLARQKAAFVPASEGALVTSYFLSN